MIKFHVVNVAHGDSIIVENIIHGQSYFGLVDCNRKDGENVVLEKLQALGAQRLEFLVLTHPHFDHYTGMQEIIQHYNGVVGQVITYPMGQSLQNTRTIKTLAQKLLQLEAENDNEKLRSRTLELVWLLQFFSQQGNNWLSDISGPSNQISPVGFDTVDIKIVQPPASAKGQYLDKVRKATLQNVVNVNDNEFSLALLFYHEGRTVLLGGDATSGNWAIRSRQFKKDDLRSDMVKLPHHGSKKDCDTPSLEMFFKPDGCGVISANGRSHPDDEVLDWLLANNITPYCTNLAKRWSRNIVVDFHATGSFSRDMKTMISQRAVESDAINSPCCGDITFIINDDGSHSIETQYNTVCGCHPNLIERLVA